MNTVNEDGQLSGSMGDRIRQRQAKAAKERRTLEKDEINTLKDEINEMKEMLLQINEKMKWQEQ